MIKNKPTIKIYINSKNEEMLKEICAGIEEEGVSFEIEERFDMELDVLCYHASKDSVLGVGIGIKESKVAIQMSPLPMGSKLFELDNPNLRQGRILGMNAARAVKRMPFKPLDV